MPQMSPSNWMVNFMFNMTMMKLIMNKMKMKNHYKKKKKYKMNKMNMW